jgi:hypothetical protein
MKSLSLRALKVLTISAGIVLGTMNTAQAKDMAPKVVPPEAAKWIPMIPEMGNKGPAFNIVFGEPGMMGKPFGGMFRVPAGGESPLHTHTSDYWAIMVSGIESARKNPEDSPTPIPPGSTWFQPAKAPHINKCMGPEDCVFFVYYPTGMDYIPTQSSKK